MFLRVVKNSSINEAQVSITIYNWEWYNRGIIWVEYTLIIGIQNLYVNTMIFPFPYIGIWLVIFEVEDLLQNGVDVNVTVYHQVKYY